MISFMPIGALIIRLSRVWQRDLTLLLGTFYWPVLDILIWGFLGVWIGKSQTAQLYNYQAAAMLGLFLWQVVGRGCNIMVASLVEELFSNNIVNLFSLPLRITEWIIGIVLFYGIVQSISSAFCMFVMSILYDLSAQYILETSLIFLVPLIFSAIWLAFTSLSIVISSGKRSLELAYVVIWFLLPFTGAYYPIEVLPNWGQALSAFLPMSYVFEGMRGYVMHNQDPTSYLIKGYALSIVYALCAIIGFVYCFNRSKQKGLARLVD